ncbi:hemolysin family protein [Gordonia araii]|uniref:hemolysin family protein n=1 Tax=Gordonia araii TaxID=263909 RepID=UPI00058C2825|nr:hemolysin family protein [Gordonia araii]NNG96792.1 HlyC/CorC family transporter [Gordonia araii NBRC 100433]
MDIAATTAAVVGFIALTIGTAIFVASEFSLTALERSTITDDVTTRGDRRSRQVDRAHRTLSFQLSGAQLGITITTLITGYLAEPVLAQFIKPALEALRIPDGWHPWLSAALALILATSLSMVLGELIPKNLAISRPLSTARLTAAPMVAFSAVFRWAINGLNGAANWMVRRLGIEPAEELASARSPQELASLVRNSARHGAIDADTAVLVDRSLRFGELTAEDLMTPRVRVTTLGPADTVDDLVRVAADTGHSRFPVCHEGDLDNLIGVVHIKQAFSVPHDELRTTRLDTIVWPVATVPASLDGDAVVEQLAVGGLEVCVVIDEYGGTAGIVTTEDVIEEIVGSVTDEHDDENEDVLPEGDGFQCSGLLRLDEVETATGLRAPDGAYDTLGGLVMFLLGRVPTTGDEVEIESRGRGDDEDESGNGTDRPAVERRWLARITAMDGRRIDTVSLQPLASDDQGLRRSRETHR